MILMVRAGLWIHAGFPSITEHHSIIADTEVALLTIGALTELVSAAAVREGEVTLVNTQGVTVERRRP